MERRPVNLQKAGMNSLFQYLDDRFRMNQLRQVNDGSQHANVEYDRFADLFHHGLVHGQGNLAGVDLLSVTTKRVSVIRNPPGRIMGLNLL